MRTIDIFSEIVDNEDKLIIESEGGRATSFAGVMEQLDAIPDDEDEVRLRIHCEGGNCIEGWAIYSALRQMDKKISAVIYGQCSSIATVFLLAAPKERRFAVKDAQMCIHYPAAASLPFTDGRLTSTAIEGIVEKCKIIAEELKDENNKILDLYVERTGTDRETLAELMEEDRFIGTDKAIELGFISEVLPEKNDYKSNPNNKKTKKMNKKQFTCSTKTVDRICAMFGVKTIDEIENLKLVDQVITATNGEFTVEREEGDPEIGDRAYPDGDYEMENGTHVIVAGGIITDITNSPEPPADPPVDNKDEGEITALNEKVAELEAKVEELQTALDTANASIAEKDAEIASQKTALDEANAKVVTDEQNAILEAVASAGGKQWLDVVMNMKSTFNATNRKFVAHKDNSDNNPAETKAQKRLRMLKEKKVALQGKKDNK